MLLPFPLHIFPQNSAVASQARARDSRPRKDTYMYPRAAQCATTYRFTDGRASVQYTQGCPESE